jgi:hypothetical protein
VVAYHRTTTFGWCCTCQRCQPAGQEQRRFTSVALAVPAKLLLEIEKSVSGPFATACLLDDEL